VSGSLGTDSLNVFAEIFRKSLDYAKVVQGRLQDNIHHVIGRNIVLTGDDPFVASELAAILPDFFVGVHVEQAPPAGSLAHLLVVGQTRFDEGLIAGVLQANPRGIGVLPQEGFVDLVLFGHNWWELDIQCLEDAASYHPGLQFVKSLEWFPWPVTEAPESAGDGNTDVAFGTETRLHMMGYWVGNSPRKLSDNERWTVLERAVKVLGLTEVVYTIANHIRLRKTQVDGSHKYRRAISKWEFDLERLRRNYYEGRPHGFQWPSTEP